MSTLTPSAVSDFGSVLLVAARAEVSGDVRRHVFRSTDRGATWSYVSTAPAVADIVFLTPTRWLQIVLPARYSSETTDGGASWRTFVTNYSQASGVGPQIAFGDAHTGYTTVRGGIQRTTDGGATWDHVRTPWSLPP